MHARMRHLRGLAGATGIAAAGTGVLVLAGWSLGSPRLTSLVEGFPPMKPLTALCFCAAGAALRLLSTTTGAPEERGARPNRAARRLGGLVALAGAASTAEWLAGRETSFAELLVPARAAGVSGRVSLATSFALVCVGLGLALRDVRFRRGHPSGVLAGGALLVGTVGLNGYLLGPDSLRLVRAYAPIALPTAALLVAFGMALLAVRPDRGALGVVVSDALGGVAARMLLPIAVLLPVVIGSLKLSLHRRGTPNLAFIEAASGAAYTVVLTALILVLARSLNRMEALRREAQERSETAARLAAVGTLAAGVAHEINNPLTYVIGALDFVGDECRQLGGHLPPDKHAEVTRALSEANEGALRVKKIVTDLKAFSRASDDATGAVQLTAILDAALNIAVAEIRQRARLVKELGETPPVVASEARLGQVFLNLLVNAAQAIRPGAPGENEIRVRAGTDSRGAFVEVIDSGAGIPPEVLPRIFDPFFTTKPVGEGTGLGLSISRSIVEGYGGTIEAESAPGRGTTIRVRLPAAPAPT